MKLSVSHNKQAIKNTWSPSITHTVKLIINANLIAVNVCVCVCVLLVSFLSVTPTALQIKV